MFIKKNITYLDKLLIRKLTNELNVFLMCEYSECVSERVHRGGSSSSVYWALQHVVVLGHIEEIRETR